MVLKVHKLWIHLDVSSTGLFLSPWSDDWRHLKKSSRRFDDVCYKVCTLTLQKKHTKHLPTPRRFDLRPTGPCFVFVYLLLIAMTSIFGLLDKRQRAEARRKKQTSGPGRFLLGGKIGAAPKGVLPKRIQMKPTDEQGSLNRTHFLRYQNVWSCWRISF